MGIGSLATKGFAVGLTLGLAKLSLALASARETAATPDAAQTNKQVSFPERVHGRFLC
jgi:hypothetical protein